MSPDTKESSSAQNQDKATETGNCFPRKIKSFSLTVLCLTSSCQKQCSSQVIVSLTLQGQFSEKFFCAVTPSSAAHNLPLQLICCPTTGSACRTHKRSTHPRKTFLQKTKRILFISKLAIEKCEHFHGPVPQSDLLLSGDFDPWLKSRFLLLFNCKNRQKQSLPTYLEVSLCEPRLKKTLTFQSFLT